MRTVYKNGDIVGNCIFLEDMGRKTSIKHSLDRINGNEGYFKENYRWATWKEQSGNKSSNILIKYKEETKCLTYWARDYNMRPVTLKTRLQIGWDMEKALTTPVRKYNYS